MENEVVKRLMWWGSSPGSGRSRASPRSGCPCSPGGECSRRIRRGSSDEPAKAATRAAPAARRTGVPAAGRPAWRPSADKPRRSRTAGDPRRRRLRRRPDPRHAPGARAWRLTPAPPPSAPPPSPGDGARRRDPARDARARRRSCARRSSSPRPRSEQGQELGHGPPSAWRPGFRARRDGPDPARLRLARVVPAVPRRDVLLGLLLRRGRAAPHRGAGRLPRVRAFKKARSPSPEVALAEMRTTQATISREATLMKDEVVEVVTKPEDQRS